MFGMRPPRTDLPPLRLVAAVLRGNKIYRLNLPIQAMNATFYDIFTPSNIAAICKIPDSIQELEPLKVAEKTEVVL